MRWQCIRFSFYDGEMCNLSKWGKEKKGLQKGKSKLPPNYLFILHQIDHSKCLKFEHLSFAFLEQHIIPDSVLLPAGAASDRTLIYLFLTLENFVFRKYYEE